MRLIWPAIAEGPQREARGAFVDLDPGKKAAWMWSAPARGVPPLVTFFIEERKGGSTVTVLHAGFSTADSFDSRYGTWQRLWEDCLAKLVLYLETGRTMKTEETRLSDLAKLRRLRPGMAVAR